MTHTDEVSWDEAITIVYPNGTQVPLVPLPIYRALVSCGVPDEQIIDYFETRGVAAYINDELPHDDVMGSPDWWQEKARATPIRQWMDGIAVMNATTEHERGIVISPTPAIPEWLRLELNAAGEHVALDRHAAFPTFFFAQSSRLDWVALADAHPEQLSLTNPWGDGPATVKIASAWEAAREEGVSGWLEVLLYPGVREGTCVAEIQGMSLESPSRDLIGIITHLAGPPESRSAQLVEWSWWF